MPHLASAGSVVLSDDGRWLLVVNAGSDEVSLFAVEPDGLRLADRVPSGGSKPTSVAVSGGLVYALFVRVPHSGESMMRELKLSGCWAGGSSERANGFAVAGHHVRHTVVVEDQADQPRDGSQLSVLPTG